MKKLSSLLRLVCHVLIFSLYVDLSSTAFIEPLPVVDFVTQLLKKDIRTRLYDADRVKVDFQSCLSSFCLPFHSVIIEFSHSLVL